MNALAHWQDAMHDWLLHGDASVAASVAGTQVDARLRIHADAYWLRLLDVLGNDFPATKAVLGERAFEALGRDYLRTHPSRHPSVRCFGHAFAGWLRAREDLPPALSQLAQFEWMQGECFDATDAPVLDMDSVARLPAEAWPMLQLQLLPATRLLPLACNAPALVTALPAGTPLPELQVDAEATWLLWRSEADVHWRRLEADEASALHAVRAGNTFAGICEQMHRFHEHDGPLRAASLLKRWLVDGLLADADTPVPD